MNVMGELYSTLILICLILIAFLLVSLLYVRPPIGAVYLRTGLGKTCILKQKGGLFLPFLHSLTLLDVQTHSLILVCEKESSLRTQDLLRVDIVVVASVRLLLDSERVMFADKTLVQGNWQAIEQWWNTDGKGRIVTLIAEFSLENLHKHRKNFVDQLNHALVGGLKDQGVELVSVSLPLLVETADLFYELTNSLDVKGLALLERQRLLYHKQRHLQQCENELANRRSHFETALQQMDWERKTFLARLQHIRFKAEADAKAEQELEEIQLAKELALEMMQRDVALTRLQTEQELHKAREGFTS